MTTFPSCVPSFIDHRYFEINYFLQSTNSPTQDIACVKFFFYIVMFSKQCILCYLLPMETIKINTIKYSLLLR